MIISQPPKKPVCLFISVYPSYSYIDFCKSKREETQPQFYFTAKLYIPRIWKGMEKRAEQMENFPGCTEPLCGFCPPAQAPHLLRPSWWGSICMFSALSWSKTAPMPSDIVKQDPYISKRSLAGEKQSHVRLCDRICQFPKFSNCPGQSRGRLTPRLGETSWPSRGSYPSSVFWILK